MNRSLILLVTLVPFAAAAQISLDGSRGRDVFAAPVESARLESAALDPSELELPSSMHEPLRVLWSGSEFLVAGRDGSAGWVATRIDSDGSILDDPPLQIDDGPSEIRDIAFDGMNFLILFVGDPRGGYGSSLYARRISAATGRLVLVDFAPILISSAEWPATGWIYDATVSFGDGYFLVAWCRQTEHTYDVATVRVTTAGEVVGPAVSLWSLRDSEEGPQVAFDGRRFLVVVYSRGSVEATFIEPSTGIPGDPFALFTPVGDSDLAFLSRLAWNGSHYLIAWSTRMVSGEYRVEGVLLQPGGSERRFALPESKEPRSVAGVSWDGSTFVVSWNAGYVQCYWSACPPTQFLMGFARVSPEMAVVAQPVSLGWGRLAAHASTPAGRTLFVYGKDERIWARIATADARRARRRAVGRDADSGDP